MSLTKITTGGATTAAVTKKLLSLGKSVTAMNILKGLYTLAGLL